MSNFRQIPPDEEPRNFHHPAAVLSLSPEELERRFGIVFEQTYDSFDYLQCAFIELRSGILLFLRRYRGEPEGTTNVCGQDGVDPDLAVDELLMALGLGKDQVTWRMSESEEEPGL